MITKKTHIALVVLSLFGMLLSACGDNISGEQNIVLIDPVTSTANYAVAERHDIVSYRVLAGKVVPHTDLVYFNSDQQFLKYGALPGTEVKAGDTIIYASTDSIDKQIDNLVESLNKDQEAYDEFMAGSSKSMEEINENIRYYQQVCNNFEKMPESEKDTYGGSRDFYNSEYKKYQKLLASANASYQHLEESIKERSELYKLDSDYNKATLKLLRNKRKDVLASAGSDGTVVAINFYDNGQYISNDNAVAAVGNFDSLEIKTDYIYESDIKKAEEVYAVVNGVKYKTSYKKMTADEKEQVGNQSSSFSTFLIDAPDATIKAGDFAVIVIIESRKENVLCVPKEAVITESGSSYVYLQTDEGVEYTLVKKGVSSGCYTEIVSGLSDGDLILSEFNVPAKAKTQKLQKGRMSSSFSGDGYLFYSKTEWIKNPVENGTTYITEVCVKNFERVEKGQVIAKVKVTSNDVEIRSLERTILRANEDLDSLVKDNKDNKNDKAINNQKEYIDELNKNLSKMKSDRSVTEIKAPYNGIITNVNYFEEGDILRYDSNIVMIAKEDDCFIYVEDSAGLLTCGNEASISYKDGNNNSMTVKGEVVTISSKGLPESLATGYALIKVSPKDMAKMSALNQGSYGYWMRSRFKVNVETRVMEDVVVIPKSAVLLKDGITYVTVLDENNKPVYKSFVSGGSDNLNYWVAEGLSEGTEICLD